MYRSGQILMDANGTYYYAVHHRDQEGQSVETIRETKVYWNSLLKRWFCSRNESIGFGCPCRHEVLHKTITIIDLYIFTYKSYALSRLFIVVFVNACFTLLDPL